MSPEAFKEMVSDLLRVSAGKIRAPNKMPSGGWTVADIMINDKPLNTEQGQAMTDILFWSQWWEVGYTTKCSKCGHRLSTHSKAGDTHAECLSNNCKCSCEIDTGVYIRDSDTTVVQALARLRR